MMTKAWMLLFLVLCAPVYGQSVADIVHSIASINELQYECAHLTGKLNDNYKNYQELNQKASIEELLELVGHENGVVACYAGWALVDRGYEDLSGIYLRYLARDENLVVIIGSAETQGKITCEFYHRLWNSVEDKAADIRLAHIDSLILYQEEVGWLLLSRALENRLYPESFNQQIVSLAFEEHSLEALLYLSTWYKARYAERLKRTLIQYMDTANFRDVGLSDYYAVVAELLSFRDYSVQVKVVEKLERDQFWKYDQSKFEDLLEKYGISKI